jgi:hypothetical protein
LSFELVSASIWTASAKVEGLEIVPDRVFHQAAIEQHVGRQVIELPQ